MVSGTLRMVLHATAQLDPSKPGFIIVPGASGPLEGDPDEVDTIPVLLARFAKSAAVPLLRKAMENPDVTVATVCGGSLALAMAGLLEGRNAVTHHLGMDLLEATGVNAVNARVVDDGDLVTSGAVTSGLDLALHLLERTYGAPRRDSRSRTLFAYERRAERCGTERSAMGEIKTPIDRCRDITDRRTPTRSRLAVHASS